MPTFSSTISYVNEEGQTKSLLEAPRVPVVRDMYVKKRFFFTMPGGSNPYECKVYLSMFPHSVVDDYVRVDDVS